MTKIERSMAKWRNPESSCEMNAKRQFGRDEGRSIFTRCNFSIVAPVH